MAKGRLVRSSERQPDADEVSDRESGRQPVADGAHAFLRAFADALRDILLEERRRAA